jgi:hypothetical protein
LYGKGLPKSLEVLNNPPEWYPATEQTAGLLDLVFFNGHGYRFAYASGVATARPVAFGTSGVRSYRMDADGVFRITADDREATIEDDILRQ